MESKKLIVEKNGRKLAEVFTFLEAPMKEKREFVTRITDRINFRNDIGFAGYKDKQFLKNFLIWSIYGNTQTSTWNSISLNECKQEIEYVLQKCSNVIEDRIIKIFIFPTIDKFVIEKMGGISGFTPWKNTILLGVFRTENWSRSLKNTVCHELAHALALNFNDRNTIEDDLVFEGIAEHFREDFLNRQKEPWVKSISEKEAKNMFQKIKPKLKISSDELYRELFFGTGRFPLWSGYAIGYYIVKDYLDKCTDKNWIKILQTNPTEIIKKVII